MKLLLSGFLLLTNGAFVLSNSSSIVNCSSLLNRGLEIRYIVVEDKTQTQITIEDITYSLFKTKKEAIEYATNLSLKKDYIIVYVMVDELKITEVLELKN